jgi:hypothetical protein
MSADAWTLTLLGLAGEPWPAPPALPGQRHICQDDGEADDAFEPPTVAELAAHLGLTRQGAWMRLQAYRKHPDIKRLLAPAQRPRAALIDTEDTTD